MKVTLLIISLSFLSIFASAQQNFEGNIHYSIQMEGSNTPKPYSELYFKGNKLLIIDVYKSSKKHVSLLYDFNKGLCYTLIKEDSVAIVSKLTPLPYHKKNIEDDKDTVNIIGHSTYHLSYSIDSVLRGTFSEVDAWFTTAIIFHVPDSVRFLLTPYFLLDGDHVSLKTISIFRQPRPLTNIHDHLIITATSISKQPVDDVIFSLPAFMKLVPLEEYTNRLLQKPKDADVELKVENIEMKAIPSSTPPPPPPPPTPADNKKKKIRPKQ